MKCSQVPMEFQELMNHFAARRDLLNHDGDSPLEFFDVKMVSQIPLETLHLVDEGCMKRWIKHVWGKFKIKRSAISPQHKLLVENLVPRLRRCISSEFNRRTKSFQEFSDFKGIDFRRILLNEGVRLFKDLDPNVYCNFLELHCAITILSSPDLVQDEDMLGIAERLLYLFTVHSGQNVGPNIVSYNIHSSRHLSDECRKYGVIDQFSACKYETFLQA